MTNFKILFALLLIIALSACMANPNIMDLSDVERSRISQIKLYKTEESPPASKYLVVDKIQGLSCWRNTQNPKIVTEEEALDGLKIRATQLNANSVVNIYCKHKETTDWSNNCWESVSCFGDAVRITKIDSENVIEPLEVNANGYATNLLGEYDPQESKLLITVGNSYAKNVYDVIGTLKIIDCQDKDYIDLRTIPVLLPSTFYFIPLPPPDSKDISSLPSYEKIKRKTIMTSIVSSANKSGADAIVNLLCQPNTGPTYKFGCKSYIQCVGDMISFK